MYLILNSDNLIAEIARHPCFVRRQANDVVVLSDEYHADAIYSNDTDKYYPREKVGYLCESYHMIEVGNVPPDVVPGYYFYRGGEFYTTEANLTALARSEAPALASIMFVSMAEKGELDDATIIEHSAQFSAWAFPVSYSAGAVCQHGGKLYRCLQVHTSQEDWSPESTPSLWKEIGDPAAEYPAWSQPIGAVDAYATGDKVSHGGSHWVSDCDCNVWEPGVYGWSEVS